MTTVTKQRKLKRLADRRMVRRFIERIDDVQPGMFLGDIEGYGMRRISGPLLTNFRYTSENVRSYVLAAKKYTKIDPSIRFGISDHTITVHEDEGWVQQLQGYGGFFLCNSRRCDLGPFWRIFEAIHKAQSHWTRRLRQKMQHKMLRRRARVST